MGTTNRGSFRGLWASMLAAAAAAIAINGIIVAAGWFNRPEALSQRSPLLPSDAVIGSVWIVLFAGMGAARWQALRSGGPNAGKLAASIVGFMVWCLAYPFLTDGLRSPALGLLVNGVTLGLNAAICLVLLKNVRRAAILMLLPIAWVAFASVGLLQGSAS